MNINWFECLIYGLIAGFTEFIPVSSRGHSILLLRLFGETASVDILQLAVRIGTLLALLLACRPQISKLSRERRLASIPPRRRKRQPDPMVLMDIRVLKVACIPAVLSVFAYPWISPLGQQLWILCMALILNGILLFAPQYMPGANKDSRSLTGLDSFLIGLGGALSVLPGISFLGAGASVAQMRGADRQHSLHICLLLCVPVMLLLIMVDALIVITSGFSGLTFAGIPGVLTAGIMAFAGAYFGIMLMRFLAVKAGFASFAFYSWGAALFTFILYIAT